MRELIEKKTCNIGSLCSFLNKSENFLYLKHINDSLGKSFMDIPLTTSEKIYYYINRINIPNLCFCGQRTKFIGFKNGHRKTCGSKECVVISRKNTCIDKYGVDNPKKSKEIKDKEQYKIKEKWDGKHYMHNNDVKAKFNSTMDDRYGVKWAQQSNLISKKSISTFSHNTDREDIIRTRANSNKDKSLDEKKLIDEKKKKTLEENWGSISLFNDYRNEKIKESSMKKWGVDHHFKANTIAKKRIDSYNNTQMKSLIDSLPKEVSFISKKQNNNNTDTVFKLVCETCDKHFSINRQLMWFRINSNSGVCVYCNPISSGKSNKELEVLDFIKSIYKEKIVSNARNIISKELDIYIPSLKIAFEFNGLYWHSDLFKTKSYHLDKSKECEDVDIQLIHIWEDDWDYKKDIVKSIISYKLNKSDRIFARKCVIKEIKDNSIVKKFLLDNHIQGFVGSRVKIGLFFEKELVSLISFGSLRKSLGHKSSANRWELLRFCNKINTSVIGGASKLFNFFIKNYNPEYVMSYSDSSRGKGNLYDVLKFKRNHQTVPNYYWVIDGIKTHRFNWRKDKLVKMGYSSDKTEIEIMNEIGYYRIFDCGSCRWDWLGK